MDLIVFVVAGEGDEQLQRQLDGNTDAAHGRDWCDEEPRSDQLAHKHDCHTEPENGRPAIETRAKP